MFSRELNDFQLKVFNLTVFITWLLYIVIALGISVNAPEYLDTLQYYVKIYICLFLMYRFNPLRRVRFTSLDAKIAFSAGIFLFTTTYVNVILQNYLKEITSFIKNSL